MAAGLPRGLFELSPGARLLHFSRPVRWMFGDETSLHRRTSGHCLSAYADSGPIQRDPALAGRASGRELAAIASEVGIGTLTGIGSHKRGRKQYGASGRTVPARNRLTIAMPSPALRRGGAAMSSGLFRNESGICFVCLTNPVRHPKPTSNPASAVAFCLSRLMSGARQTVRLLI